MKKEYIAPRAAAIRLAMEDTMLTGSKLSTDGACPFRRHHGPALPVHHRPGPGR